MAAPVMAKSAGTPSVRVSPASVSPVDAGRRRRRSGTGAAGVLAGEDEPAGPERGERGAGDGADRERAAAAYERRHEDGDAEEDEQCGERPGQVAVDRGHG